MRKHCNIQCAAGSCGVMLHCSDFIYLNAKCIPKLNRHIKAIYNNASNSERPTSQKRQVYFCSRCFYVLSNVLWSGMNYDMG